MIPRWRGSSPDYNAAPLSVDEQEVWYGHVQEVKTEPSAWTSGAALTALALGPERLQESVPSELDLAEWYYGPEYTEVDIDLSKFQPIPKEDTQDE